MSLFKHHSEQLPLQPADTEASERVLTTLERSNLDPHHILLVGSAALALYGVTLSPDERTGASRPGDIDLLTTTHYAEQLYNTGKGTVKDIVNRDHMTVLRFDAEPLPIDIITAPQESLDLARYDRHLQKRMDGSRVIAGLGVRVLSLPDIIAAKKHDMPEYDPKVADDLASAQATLARMKRDRQ